MTPIEIRQSLHQNPGISGDEHYAHDLIMQELEPCHPDKVYHHVGGYGIVAVWGKELSHPTIAIRGDIDALPIGHRCGHDGHTAILMQLAQSLGKEQINPNWNIILIFQHEEETGTGSQKILDSGILQQYNIKAIFGFHNLPGFPLGTAVLNYHTFAAASSGVIYHLTGRNTHASTPEKGINPGMAIAEIIQNFNNLNSKPNADNDHFRQSTLICIHLGEEAFGTSAGEAEIMFTLRAFTNSTMQQLLSEANSMVAQIASRHKLRLSHTLRDPFRATESQSQMVEHIEQALSDDGLPFRHILTPFRWSEDFANYLLSFPGAMLGIGSGEKQPELHHPDYNFPDALISPAANILLSIIRHFTLK